MQISSDLCRWIYKLDISVSVYNPSQNIWNRIGKSSKSGRDKKSLISTFACFLTATDKCFHPNLRFP